MDNGIGDRWVENFAEAILARRDVGQNQGSLFSAIFAFPDLESAVTDRIEIR